MCGLFCLCAICCDARWPTWVFCSCLCYGKLYWIGDGGVGPGALGAPLKWQLVNCLGPFKARTSIMRDTVDSWTSCIASDGTLLCAFLRR